MRRRARLRRRAAGGARRVGFVGVVAVLAILAAAAAVVAALIGGVRRLLAGSRTIAGVVVRMPTDDTRIDADGAVRSIQAADIMMPVDMLLDLWTPETLERLAR